MRPCAARSSSIVSGRKMVPAPGTHEAFLSGRPCLISGPHVGRSRASAADTLFLERSTRMPTCCPKQQRGEHRPSVAAVVVPPRILVEVAL